MLCICQIQTDNVQYFAWYTLRKYTVYFSKVIPLHLLHFVLSAYLYPQGQFTPLHHSIGLLSSRYILFISWCNAFFMAFPAPVKISDVSHNFLVLYCPLVLLLLFLLHLFYRRSYLLLLFLLYLGLAFLAEFFDRAR